MEQKEKKEIIHRINKFKIREIDLFYDKERTDIEYISKIEKIRYHRFITRKQPVTITFYKQLIIINCEISITIPIVDTTIRHIFFDYDYYSKVYKVNRTLGLIHKRYIIDLEKIELPNVGKLDTERKDISLWVLSNYCY